MRYMAALEVEDILVSRGMVRLLKILSIREEINITQLNKLANLNYHQVNKYLSMLVRHGLVEEKRFGRIKIYRCNLGNRYMRAIREFILSWYSGEA